MKTRVLASCAVVAVLAAACEAPKFVSYRSVFKDFDVSVPWGWNVYTEAEGDGFAETKFVGPMDADFFLGAPSLSIRWYKNYRPRHLRGGSVELYSGPDDFVRQTLRDVYGPDALLYGTGRRPDGGREFIDGPEDMVLEKGKGFDARYFVVLSGTPAPPASHYGVESDAKTGRSVNVRLHGYAVVPMDGGFYVLCYPATRRGFDKAVQAFQTLLGTFHPLTAGPAGLKVRPPAR